MPYKKKAPARKKKFVGGAIAGAMGVAKRKRKTSGLSDAQKRLLGSVQREAKKKGAGAITNKMVELTRKHGDHSGTGTKPKAPATKQRGRGGRGLLGNLKNAIKRSGGLGKINRRRPGGKMPRIMSTVTGSRKAKELARKRRTGGIAMSPAARAAMKKKQMEAMKRRGGRRVKRRTTGGPFSRLRRAAVGSARRRPAGTRAAMLRAAAARRRAAAARRRPSTLSRAAAARRRAAAARRRVATRSRRVGRPATRRPVARGRRGLGRAVRMARKALR
jgi:hypothetical protein